MTTSWSNWSGSLRFSPGRIARPTSEEELAEVVRAAAGSRHIVRVVGAGHSSTPLVRTGDVLVSLEHLQGVLSHDHERGEAVIAAGSVIHDIGEPLLQAGLAMPNTGDVDVQTLAGAIATGTHGTGRALGNLATLLLGGRLVDGTGATHDVAIETRPDRVAALRVSLGACGIMTRLRVRLVPAYRLRRREWCTHIDSCIEHLPAMIADNRNFDFYWYPRSDLARLRTLNEPDEPARELTWASCVRDESGWSHEVLPRTRELRFDEMEYALPAAAGPACFQDVRTRVREKWRAAVGWRLLYPTVAGDDAYLSPMHHRETVTISIHHNAGLPFEQYFADIEPILRAYGGRPHWAKKHNLKARELRPLYDEWDSFHRVREAFDPGGTFLSPDLRALLIDEGVS